jgi:hypothetical protein
VWCNFHMPLCSEMPSIINPVKAVEILSANRSYRIIYTLVRSRLIRAVGLGICVKSPFSLQSGKETLQLCV